MRRKAMECLLKLKSLKECKRKVCPCAEKIRQYAVHIPIDDVDVDYDYFDEVCWPILGHRVKAFENLKVCIEFGTDLYQTIA